MGSDGTLTSVFIRLKISPDTNLMKKNFSKHRRLEDGPGISENFLSIERGCFTIFSLQRWFNNISMLPLYSVVSLKPRVY